MCIYIMYLYIFIYLFNPITIYIHNIIYTNQQKNRKTVVLQSGSGIFQHQEASMMQLKEECWDPVINGNWPGWGDNTGWNSFKKTSG